MPTLGNRLLTERERLGLSQTDLAEKCRVTMRSQRNYEKNERLPDAAYLVAIAAAGADVQYILTGVPLTDAHAQEAWRLAAQTTEEAEMGDAARASARAALLKGLREQGMSSYTQDEIDLIARYRACKTEDRAMISRMALTCSKNG